MKRPPRRCRYIFDMSKRRDRLTIGGRDVLGEEVGSASDAQSKGPAQPFLSVWFRCCNVYGRMQRNEDCTHYCGRCPKCGAAVTARIGPDGTARRVFEAR